MKHGLLHWKVESCYARQYGIKLTAMVWIPVRHYSFLSVYALKSATLHQCFTNDIWMVSLVDTHICLMWLVNLFGKSYQFLFLSLIFFSNRILDIGWLFQVHIHQGQIPITFGCIGLYLHSSFQFVVNLSSFPNCRPLRGRGSSNSSSSSSPPPPPPPPPRKP